MSEEFKPVGWIGGLNVPMEVIHSNVETNAQRKLPTVSVRKAVVCGGGPSIADQLESIRAKQAQGYHVYALNNTVKYLKSHGIQPNCQFLMDARPENIEFILPIDPDITYFIASQCDPSVFDALKDHGKVHMVHVLCDNLDQLKRVAPGSSILTSCPTAGIMVLNLLTVLGYMVVDLYGYDSSYSKEAHHAYEQKLNDGQKDLDFRFNGKVYLSSGPMARQAETFIQFYRRYSPHMNITVHGDGLLPDMWRFHEYIRTHGSIEHAEKVKYEKMWTIEDYRKDSPGEDHLERALQLLKPEAQASFIDFGCGPGRALSKLLELGYDAVGIDIATNCVDPELREKVQVISACLWELPLVEADYGICNDVMEHIPPHKVFDTLAGISRSVRKSCFFSISFHYDAFGERIGEKLHLTVQPKHWWYHQLTKHWQSVQCVDECGFLCQGPIKRFVEDGKEIEQLQFKLEGAI